MTRAGLHRLANEWPPEVSLVAGIAGDRPLTRAEKAKIARAERSRGEAFYADLLFALSQQYYPEDVAQELWRGMLGHKKLLTKQLGRDPGVVVAAIDYLSNVREVLDSPTAVSSRRLQSIAEVALRDGLTGLYDQAAFWHKLRAELERFKRYGYEVSVVMLDLDHFKNVNDTLGHEEGDNVLSEIADIMRLELREVDVPARYGGEEFAMILPHTPWAEAVVVAERTRRHVENRYTNETRLTVSLGIAECPAHATAADELVKAADEALYTSKRSGRNKTSVCEVRAADSAGE